MQESPVFVMGGRASHLDRSQCYVIETPTGLFLLWMLTLFQEILKGM